MLYTVLSEFDIFFEDYAPDEMVDVSGRQIEYISLNKNKQITNLFSTNPAMYLNQRYMPGKHY
ncbi:MAG: hypothetical protein IJX54_04320 [Oscillospiraceae bacterium]|nr:hypothetical protein [Oscillospiraceae bacterium]